MRLREVLEREGEPLLLGALQQLGQPLHRRRLLRAELVQPLLERGARHLEREVDGLRVALGELEQQRRGAAWS